MPAKEPFLRSKFRYYYTLFPPIRSIALSFHSYPTFLGITYPTFSKSPAKQGKNCFFQGFKTGRDFLENGILIDNQTTQEYTFTCQEDTTSTFQATQNPRRCLIRRILHLSIKSFCVVARALAASAHQERHSAARAYTPNRKRREKTPAFHLTKWFLPLRAKV